MKKEDLLEIAKPILFNTEMTKAILEGRKTQTRRAIKIKNKLTREWAESSGIDWIKEQNEDKYRYAIRERNGGWAEYSLEHFIEEYSKYKVGDILWVREPAKVVFYQPAGNQGGSYIEDYAHVEYLSDGEINYYWDEFPENPKSWLWDCKGIPNGCCKSLARIFLKVTNVRVERLRDISNEERLKEGIKGKIDFAGCSWYETDIDKDASYQSPYSPFRLLWNSNAKDGYKWEDNPYVFVYEFERIKSF